MRLSAFLFFIRETYLGMKRSSLMTIIAVATVSITLIILGVFMLISANLRQISDDILSKLDIKVFLKSNLSSEDVYLFKQKLERVNGVMSVEFIDKDVSWKSFKAGYGHLNLGDYIDQNPLPHSLNISLTKYQNIQAVILYLKRFDTLIDDIVYGGKLADRVSIVSNFMKVSGWTLIIILIFASLFIIVNTIRLTVIARNEEISIMRLVGATDLFIKFPFIFEGLIIGIVGSSISFLILFFIYRILVTYLIQIMPFFPFISDNISLYYIYSSVIILGAFIGMFGAYISVTRSLKLT